MILNRHLQASCMAMRRLEDSGYTREYIAAQRAYWVAYRYATQLLAA